MTVFYFVSLYKNLQTLRKKTVLDFFFFPGVEFNPSIRNKQKCTVCVL